MVPLPLQGLPGVAEQTRNDHSRVGYRHLEVGHSSPMGEEEPLAGMLWVERIEDEALQDPKEDELFRRLGED